MIDYDPETALIVVDMQNDFADPAGSLHVRDGEKILPAVNAEIERAIEKDSLVVYTRDWHPETTPHFEKDGGIWPVHCVADSWGAEFHPDLVVAGHEIRKGTGGEDGYSGFTMRDPRRGEERSTGLAEMLADRQIGRVVVIGLALDYCVKATALDAVSQGLETVVLESCTRAVELEAGDGARALSELTMADVRVA